MFVIVFAFVCICVPYSFLNSYFHKLSENVWVRESGARSFGEFWSGVTIARRTNKERWGYSANGPWKAEMSNKYSS